MNKIYFNCTTGEVTEEHITAVAWYRNGYNVNILNADFKVVCSWINEAH